MSQQQQQSHMIKPTKVGGTKPVTKGKTVMQKVKTGKAKKNPMQIDKNAPGMDSKAYWVKEPKQKMSKKPVMNAMMKKAQNTPSMSMVQKSVKKTMGY